MVEASAIRKKQLKRDFVHAVFSGLSMDFEQKGLHLNTDPKKYAGVTITH